MPTSSAPRKERVRDIPVLHRQKMRQNRAHHNQQDRLRAPRWCVGRQKDVLSARANHVAQTIEREVPSSLLDPIYLDDLAQRLSGFLRKELPAFCRRTSVSRLKSFAAILQGAIFPMHVVGHGCDAGKSGGSPDFVPFWSEGSDSFLKDPPNATLSFLEDKTLEDAVVELRDPILADNDLSYQVKILEG